MIPAADFTQSRPANEQLDKLSDVASKLSVEVVDIAGVLDQIDETTTKQLHSLNQVRTGAKHMLDGNANVRAAIDTINETTQETLEAVITSVENIQSAGNRTQNLAAWVQSLDGRITSIEETLKSAQTNNNEIASIASQVNILAINAKIEAARAGEAGRGFAVVAEAINELSHKTAGAAEGISDSILTLSEWVDSLRVEAGDATENASSVLSEADDTDIALSGIAEHVRLIHSEAKQIKTNAESVDQTIGTFGQNFDQMGAAFEQSAAGIHTVRQRADAMVDQSELLVQSSVLLGGASHDAKFILEIQTQTARVIQAFEDGIRNGSISRDALFSKTLRPIAGSNPPQFMSAFTAFTDRILPPIQEPVLEFDSNIVFCAAINRGGYIPTHNKKFSHPQGADPVVNMAKSRNRRVFDDKVGLKAGNNKEPFLLQVYRRDMGGGKFVTMKDISAPIFVNGELWGGLRMAYTV